MKSLTLSDHTHDKLRQAADARQNAYAKAVSHFESVQGERERLKRERWRLLRQKWKSRDWWGVLMRTGALIFGPTPKLPPQPRLRKADDSENIWVAGREGEQSVAAYLGMALSDEWTLVSGYKNAKGEVDQLLVGPPGVFALEIKHINGEVHVCGDRWRRDKFDRYGNLVERDLPIADKRGRSPSQQINQAVDLLQMQLTRRLGEGRVRRAVVLSHEGSELGSLVDLTIDAVVVLNDWEHHNFFGGEAVLAQDDVLRVIEVIRKDHVFHDQKFRSRREGADSAKIEVASRRQRRTAHH